MSSRVLKKKLLLHGKETVLGEEGSDGGEQLSEEDDIQEQVHGKNNLNPFDLLNQQSFSESEVKEDDNETEHASTAANLNAAPVVSKKKKKKRKKKSKYTGNHISSEDNELTDKYYNDIFIGKVAEATNQHNAKPSTPRIEVDKSLLSVEVRNLNPHNEMRRTFGKRVVKIENKRGRQKLTLKTTYMVTPKESWPPVTKNIIIMRPTSPPDQAVGSNNSAPHSKVQWFAFEHSQYYQNVQNLFLAAVERTDSDFLINLIRRCPYHVDSLIQLSELCKITEDFSLAAELIERAVLVLESSLHPSFSFTSTNCRLDYRRQENRSMFIVLFKHAQYLEARACCRTAFEISKLILSLSPDVDPLAMVLVIDYYALRSKQYAWLVKFYDEFDAARNLSQLPNMAYSYALAVFCLYGECEKADKALQYALFMFPGVLRPLLEELSVQTDKRVLAASFFTTDVSNNQSPALHQLICLYICRAKVVWRQQSNILHWLERNVNSVLDRVDQKDEIVAEYKAKRNVRYVTPPRPILRHVIISDYKNKVPLAPFLSKEKDPIVMYDPLPPLDSVNFYERKSSSSSPTTAPNHSVSMFFQSLLPSFNINAADQPPNLVDAGVAGEAGVAAGRANANAAVAAAANADGVAAQAQNLRMNLENAVAEGAAAGIDPNAPYRELTQSFTNIVDAMRDFLQNFRIADPLATADGDENNSSEEDTT